MSPRRYWFVVAALTLLGFVLRLHYYGGSLVGDELSTLWIVDNHGLGGTVDFVSGDGEITPPLYFILAWFATKLGSAPELVRLPSLIAGVASIPLVYQLGVRTLSRAAGLIAATVLTLSPFMIYFSANGRPYALMTLFLIGSTLAMLAAVRTGRVRWWVAFAVLTCLTMYTHYTAVFVIAGQYLWLLWAHPAARKAGLLTAAGAAVLFLPWIGGFLSDFDSPTTEILEAIQGTGFTVKRLAFETWAFGHPLMEPKDLPGNPVVLLMSVGLLVAFAAVAMKAITGERGIAGSIRDLPKETVLVVVLALATPVGETLLLLVGTDLLGARNMASSWFGFALLIGALIAGAGLLWGTISAVLVIGGFGFGAVKTVGNDGETPDFKGASEYIERTTQPDDVVIDGFGAGVTPVPLTPMQLYLRDEQNDFPLNLPTSEPPFLPFTVEVPSPDKMVKRAFREARDGRVYLIKPDNLLVGSVDDPGREDLDPSQPAWADRELILPRGARIVEEKRFDGLNPPSLLVIEKADAAPGRNASPE